mgnify:CR=1 FL=1
MKTLALRIYLAVVAVLLLFALTTGWLAKRNIEREREHFMSQQSTQRDRVLALAELIENSLPMAKAPDAAQRDALLDWSQRLRVPMAWRCGFRRRRFRRRMDRWRRRKIASGPERWLRSNALLAA